MRTSTIMLTTVVLLLATSSYAGGPDKINKLISKGKFENAQNLITKKGLDLNTADKNGVYPLQATLFAVNANKANGQVHIKGKAFALFLLDSGAKPYRSDQNPCKENAFAHCLTFGLTDLATDLIDRGYDPTGCDQNMNYAAQHDDITIVKKLLDLGVSPNGKRGEVRSPLNIALYGKQRPTPVAEALLDAGANINSIDDNGFSPIHLTLWNEKRELTKRLVEMGANMDKVDNFGMAPLHIVVEQKDHAFQELLLSNGADPNVQGKDGRTPLHQAAKDLDDKAVAILLKNSASPNIFSTDSLLPIHLACTYETKDMSCYRLLMGGGSKLVMNTSQPMFAEASGIMYKMTGADSSNSELTVKAIVGYSEASNGYQSIRKQAKKELGKRRGKMAAMIILGTVQSTLGYMYYGPTYYYTPFANYSTNWAGLTYPNDQLEKSALKNKIKLLDERIDTCDLEVVTMKRELGIELEGKDEMKIAKKMNKKNPIPVIAHTDLN